MAKRRKRSSKTRGGTFTGIIIGLILGLVAAVAVALYVTKAPMPFYDRASREPSQIILPDVRDAPDPNSRLHDRRADLPADVRIPEPTQIGRASCREPAMSFGGGAWLDPSQAGNQD